MRNNVQSYSVLENQGTDMEGSVTLDVLSDRSNELRVRVISNSAKVNFGKSFDPKKGMYLELNAAGTL